MQFKTAQEWKNAIGSRGHQREKVLTDILSALEQGNEFSRPYLQEVVVDVEGNSVALANELTGLQVVAIIAENNAGNAVEGNSLAELVAGITGGGFREKYFLNKAISDSTTLFQTVGTLNLPKLISTDLVINLNEGHNIISLHIFIVGPLYLSDGEGNNLGDGEGNSLIP